MAQPQSKRNSLSISTGPKPLHLVSPLSARNADAYFPSDSSSPALPTPPLTTSTTSLKRHGSSRRQSSISYNPSPRRLHHDSTVNTPISPQFSAPQDALVDAAPRRELTLMELHSSLLAQIAQREERNLELKAMLKTNEEELVALKKQWTTIVSSTSDSRSAPSPISPSHPSQRQQQQQQQMPNIADPFYGLTSPSFDGILREGAKGVSKFLSTFSMPPSPGPETPSSSRAKQEGLGVGYPPNLKRRTSRENRDSASSSGSGTSAASSAMSGRSGETDPTSVEEEEGEKPLIDFGEEGSSTSLSRSSSLSNGRARRRSRQLASEESSTTSSSTTMRKNSASPSSSSPPSAFRATFATSPSTTSPTATSATPKSSKRNTISAPIPGLGLVNAMGGLFSSSPSENKTPLTLTPKRSSGSAIPPSSTLSRASTTTSATSKHAKRKSTSILGGFNWDEMLAPSSVEGSRAGSPVEKEKKKEVADEWNW